MESNSPQLPLESVDLFVPELKELGSIIEDGLKSNFKFAKVEVVDCPDLSQPPFHLAAKGNSGVFTIPYSNSCTYPIFKEVSCKKNKYYVSEEHLEENHKNIFLYICCFESESLKASVKSTNQIRKRSYLVQLVSDSLIYATHEILMACDDLRMSERYHFKCLGVSQYNIPPLENWLISSCHSSW